MTSQKMKVVLIMKIMKLQYSIKMKKWKKEKLSLKKKSEISEEIVDRIVAQIN